MISKNKKKSATWDSTYIKLQMDLKEKSCQIDLEERNVQPEVAHTSCSHERRRKNSVSKNETEETCNLKLHSPITAPEITKQNASAKQRNKESATWSTYPLLLFDSIGKYVLVPSTSIKSATWGSTYRCLSRRNVVQSLLEWPKTC